MKRATRVRIGDFEVGDGRPLCVIAGPCVAESPPVVLRAAREARKTCAALGLNYVFKASFDKANRTSGRSFRGHGLERGLELIRRVKEEVGVPVTTDVHETSQVDAVARAVDLIQIPAFLCRQTDLLRAAAQTGLPLNIKKGQFMAPWDMRHVVEKVRAAGGRGILLTERGTSFGYGRLVSDLRSLPIMRELGCPVAYDASHSQQEPGGLGNASGGDRRFIPVMARAAAAVGIDALFLEIHPRPDRALSDGPTSLRLADLPNLLRSVVRVLPHSRLPRPR